MTTLQEANLRKTTQRLMPARHTPLPPGHYDIYPLQQLAPGVIVPGYANLARQIAAHESVIIDGYPGVDWNGLRVELESAMTQFGTRATWARAEAVLKTPSEIDTLLAPALGGDDPIFGKRFDGSIGDFFAQTPVLPPAETPGPRILYGCGAGLTAPEVASSLLIYIDLPKNEIQFRARGGAPCHIGAQHTSDPKAAYKRCYFVDWVVADRHKAALLQRIDIIVDMQRPTEPASMSGTHFRAALRQTAHTCLRTRPWFEPGPWGGQWIKTRMPQLPQDAPNYAWSFELISPENGIVFASDGWLLEVTFDWLMIAERAAIMGDFAAFFGAAFPIRFDFLDTFAGGNLSVQCHPRPDYIRKHFGEDITQDETYYMLDCGPDARVYLGFQEGVDPAAFRSALENSQTQARAFDIDSFVQSQPARKHDLFLIPNGTVHCSGRDALVLEISATPYIFTFKMYDWMRLDLDGRPRPLNIARAFENLYFERAGARVRDELVSKQVVIARGDDWQLVHCPTHAQHFYDVHRVEFTGQIEIATQGSPHVLSLVEGAAVTVQCSESDTRTFSYAETFVIPASVTHYRLISSDNMPLKVIKAFIKPVGEWAEGSVP